MWQFLRVLFTKEKEEVLVCPSCSTHEREVSYNTDGSPNGKYEDLCEFCNIDKIEKDNNLK